MTTVMVVLVAFVGFTTLDFLVSLLLQLIIRDADFGGYLGAL